MPVQDTPAHRTVDGDSLVLRPPTTLDRRVWVAALGDLSILVILLWAIETAPGGFTGVADLPPAARLVLIRVTAALAVAVCGTWLARTQPRSGGLLLMGTALATSIILPSVFWCIPATLLGTAGGMLVSGRTRSTPTHAVAGAALLALASIALSPCAVAVSSVGTPDLIWPVVGLALMPAGTIFTILASIVLTGARGWKIALPIAAATSLVCVVASATPAPGPLVTAYAQIPGARAHLPVGDSLMPVLPPSPTDALTPLPAQSSIHFGVGEARLPSGTSIAIPVDLRTDVPVDAIAFDLDYDPAVLTIEAIDVGQALQDAATEGRFSVLSLPGVVGENGTLTNAGVGLLTGTTETVGPTTGTVAVITARGVQAGTARLVVKNVVLYSWLNEVRRHHQFDASPRPLTLTVTDAP